MLNDGRLEELVVEVMTETKAERARRRALGIYYTPPEAAQVLARWAIRNPNETLLEPSFGGCAMLAAAVGAYEALGNKKPADQLYGYDIDAAAFTHLAELKVENSKGHFKRQDFLRSLPGDLRVDAVLANPPYISYHRLNKSQRQLVETLRQKYLPQLPKLASLWVHFILHSLSFLREGGRMAFVLPTAVGTADYAKPLLVFLQKRFSAVELVHVTERMFIQAGADERVSLLLLNDYHLNREDRFATLQTKYISKVSEITVGSAAGYSLFVSDLSQDLLELAAMSLSKLPKGILRELGEDATVRIGEVVGDIKFFVRPLSEWKKLKISPKYLFPLLTKAAQISGIYIEDHMDEFGTEKIPYLLIPPEKRIPNSIKEYLSVYSNDDIEKSQTFKRRPSWCQCTYDVSADAFIGSINHEYPRMIANGASIGCSNAFYKIRITNDDVLRRWLPLISLSTPFRLTSEMLGRVRGSGGIKLEPSDVKKLLIPGSLPIIDEVGFSKFQGKIRNSLLKGELEQATNIIDEVIFVETGLLSREEINTLQNIRLKLTNRRLNRVI